MWADTSLLSLFVVVFSAFYRRMLPVFLYSAMAVQFYLCWYRLRELRLARKRYLEALQEYMMRGGVVMLSKRRGRWHAEPIKRPGWLP